MSFLCWDKLHTFRQDSPFRSRKFEVCRNCYNKFLRVRVVKFNPTLECLMKLNPTVEYPSGHIVRPGMFTTFSDWQIYNMPRWLELCRWHHSRISCQSGRNEQSLAVLGNDQGLEKDLLKTLKTLIRHVVVYACQPWSVSLNAGDISIHRKQGIEDHSSMLSYGDALDQHSLPTLEQRKELLSKKLVKPSPQTQSTK